MAEQQQPCTGVISPVLGDIDPNAAPSTHCQTPKIKLTGPRYTKEDLFDIGRSTHHSRSRVELTGALRPSDAHNAPYINFPAPSPHTTPTLQSGVASDTVVDNAEVNGVGVENSGETGVVAAEVKKKKKSSGIHKKLKVNPTGFEEFYADPPTTPEDYQVESDLYHPDRDFHQRIETCIQRYRARRKLDSVRSNIFSKYLIIGGIEATGKSFTGGALDKETLETSTAEEIAAVQATDFVRSGVKNTKYYDPNEAENWVVDFEGIAKGFFSRIIPNRIGADTDEEINLASAVIRNFLNYVLQHNVCPEYIEDVMAARRICDLAEKDLMAIKSFRTELPGDFNIAASTVCGGFYQSVFVATQAWQSDNDPQNEHAAVNVGFSGAQATRIFNSALAFKGSDNLFKKAESGGIYIIKTETKAYEVVEIERASTQFVSEVATIKDHTDVAGNIKPLGIMKVKAWEGPGLDPEDMSDDEEHEEATKESRIDSFWLEDDILRLMNPGLKLELVVRELNIGIKFFDRILGLYCSFHTYLENEKLNGWKEPGKLSFRCKDCSTDAA
ncbi:Argonaute-binding protein [Lachnellula hyalina]|uniref:Argonaute-binding protein n=1 Tax=Lachnellula hyalina TaxID=1316788 RepID=A0A8H8TY86_9HELO|nr:Argonaute-binding protein [Lachnellula hyalina]TVY23681.1 Argonaute-binding protein [Lachnellula hyalina]